MSSATGLAAKFEDLCESLPDAVISGRHADISAIHEVLAGPYVHHEGEFICKKCGVRHVCPQGTVQGAPF